MSETAPFQDSERQGSWVYAGLVILIAWLPIPFGSDRPWAWAIMEVSAFTLLWLWLALNWRRPSLTNEALLTAWPALVLFAAWIGYTLFQLIPLPAGLAGIVNSATAELIGFVHPPAGSRAIPFAIDSGATIQEFFKNLAYVTIFILILLEVNTQKRLITLAFVMVMVSLAGAMYGLFNVITGMELVLWHEKRAYQGSVTGTFVSRNHFAGHLGMVIPLALGLMIAYKPKPRYYHTLWVRLLQSTSFLLERWGRIAAVAAIMLATLFLSASRAGVVALLIALVITLCLAYFARGAKSREVRIIPFLLVAGAGAVAWFGLGRLPGRISGTAQNLGERMQVWSESLQIVGDHPLFGVGAGGFQYIYPLYSGGYYGGYFDHAHNEYIELLVDYGVIGALLAGGGTLYLFVTILRGFFRRKDPVLRGLLAGSLAGVMAVFIHALVDFNLHIPANAAYFFTLLGIGMVASTLNGGRSRSRVRRKVIDAGQS